MKGLDAGRWASHRSVIIPTVTSLGKTGGFLAPALRIRGVGDGAPLALFARTRWVTGRNGLRRFDPIKANQRRIHNGYLPRPTE